MQRTSLPLRQTAKESVVSFTRNQLDTVQPSNDYRELLELTLIFLGEITARGVWFMMPGATRQARWMFCSVL